MTETGNGQRAVAHNHGGTSRTWPLSRRSFTEMMAILVTSKLHTELSKQHLEVWYSMLRMFQTKTVQRAVLELSLSPNAFPHLGALYQLCRRIELERGDDKPLAMAELNELANSLGLRDER